MTVAAAQLRPVLDATSASLSIGSVDISLSGSAWDWLLNLFKSELEGAVRKALDSSFGATIEAFINEDGNALLAGIPIEVPIPVRAPYNVSQARFGFVSAPSASAALLGFAVQGDVTPLNFSGDPPIAPPALPPFDSSAAAFMVEGRFSSYLLQSAVWTYWTQGLMAWAIPAAGMPLGLNASAAYALIAPGLAAAFPGGSVSLGISLSGLPSISISPLAAGGISAEAPLDLLFSVKPASGGAPQAAFHLLAAAGFSLQVGVIPDASAPGSLVFNGTLSYLSASLSAGNSTVGPVSVGLLQALVDVVLPGLVAVLNGQLQAGFPLPPIPGVAFESATALELQSGYALFAANFTYTPPKVWGA
jgi:hypothetical protein